SHSFRGRASAEGVAWVAAASAGSLRLVDNGVIGPGGERVYHLLPSPAGKAPAVARDLAVRDAEPAACLAVGDSLEDLELAAVAGHAEPGPGEACVEAHGLEDERRPRAEGRPEERDHAARRPAGGAGAGQAGDVDPGLAGEHPGQVGEPDVEALDRRRSGALL